MDVKMEKMGLDPEKLREFLSQQHEEQVDSSPDSETPGGDTGQPTIPPGEKLNFSL